MRRHIWIAGILALLASTALVQQAMAQDPQQDLEGSLGGNVVDRAFGNVDRDGDKTISKSELLEAYGGENSSERAFLEMDRNADGVLSEQEYMLPGNTGEVVSPGENPYEPLNPGESGVKPLPPADEYGITREQGTTGGISPMDGSTEEPMTEPKEESRARQGAESEAEEQLDMRESPYASQEMPERGELRSTGEMGDQEGRGPAEVPTSESYGSPDYDTTPEYWTPPAGDQGGSGNIDQQGDPRETEVPKQ